MPKAPAKLTETVARNLPLPAAGYEIHWCPRQPGFGLRVTSNGARSWIVERRVDGATVRRTVGHAVNGRNAITADAARAKSLTMLGELADGVDRVVERRASRTREKAEREVSALLKDAIETYIAAKQNVANDKPMKARTAADLRLLVRAPGVGPTNRQHAGGGLHPLAEQPLNRIAADEIKALERKLAKASPTQAGIAMRNLRAVLRWHGVSMERDPFALTTPAVHRVRTKGSKTRNRVITDLPRWWEATQPTEHGDAFRFALLTGLRRGEMAQVVAGDFNAAAGTLRVGDTKNHRPHLVYLSKPAFAIVKARAKGLDVDDRLFPTQPQKTLDRIRAASEPFSMHDLRRTFATIAGSRVPAYVLKTMMNHGTSGDVTAEHYLRFGEVELRAGWKTVADYIESLLKAKRSRT